MNGEKSGVGMTSLPGMEWNSKGVELERHRRVGAARWWREQTVQIADGPVSRSAVCGLPHTGTRLALFFRPLIT